MLGFRVLGLFSLLLSKDEPALQGKFAFLGFRALGLKL